MKKSFIVRCVVTGFIVGIFSFAFGRGWGRGGGRAGGGSSRASSARVPSSRSSGMRATASRGSAPRTVQLSRSSAQRISAPRASVQRTVQSSPRGVTPSRRLDSSRPQRSKRVTSDSLSRVRANSTRQRAIASQQTAARTAQRTETAKRLTSDGRKAEVTQTSRARLQKKTQATSASTGFAAQKAKATAAPGSATIAQKATGATTVQKITTVTPTASGKTVTKTVTTYSGNYHHGCGRYYRDGGWWGYGYGWAFGVYFCAGVALGIAAGYYPGWYWMYPYQTSFWGPYYVSPFAAGLYYYPNSGYWYYSSMRSWYSPWFGGWYYPSMWTWYYPRVEVAVVSYVDKPQPYIVIDNDTEKRVYYAFYEREKAEDAIAFYRKGLVNKISSTGSRKIYIPKGDVDAFILVSRSQDMLRDVVLQADIDNQQNPLVLIDVSKTKKQTIESKDLARKSNKKEDARETEDLTLIREKLREQDQQIKELSEKIDTSIEKDKNVPEGSQEQEEQQIPESVPVPGKKPLIGKEPTAGKKQVKPVKPVQDEESIEEAAPAA